MTNEDALAIRSTALQQEMMVAAFMCHDITAYNSFVVTHQSDLQAADAALLKYFARINGQDASAAYNTYKTELANASSLRFLHDRQFCQRVAADFEAASGRPLTEALKAVPFQVDTGSVSCGWASPPPVMTAAAPPPQAPAQKRVRHRTWLGQLVDWLFH